MNFLQGPPNHYPSSQDPTPEVFRTRNFSVTTNASSPPGYHAERAPPRYQEATEAEAGEHTTEEGARKARKIRWIRIASSIFIVTTVSLIVAGVVGKINGMKADQGTGQPQNSQATTITMTSKESARSAIEELPSTTDGTAMPTGGIFDTNSENLKEASHEGTNKDGDEDEDSTTSDTKSDSDQLGQSFREQLAERNTDSICGISLHRQGRMDVENTQELVECLKYDISKKTNIRAEGAYEDASALEKVKREPRINNPEWNSG